MNNTFLNSALLSIRDKFIKIRTMTESIDPMIEQEYIGETLNKRGEIIAEVSAEQQALRVTDPTWQQTAKRFAGLADIMRDIETIVGAVKEMDDRLAVVLTQRLDTMRNELKGLYHTSRAASAYTTHAQSAYRLAP